MLQIGQKAPDFELPDQDGSPFRLGDWFSNHAGQWLLLVFYLWSMSYLGKDKVKQICQ